MEGIIRWSVNDTLLERNELPPDITPGTTRDDSGGLVDTLTITARPEYDGASDKQTEPALLLGSSYFSLQTGQESSTRPPCMQAAIIIMLHACMGINYYSIAS